MKEIERPQLEYNLAGGLLLTLKEEDLLNLCQGLEYAGYKRACFLPFRSLVNKEGKKILEESPLTIVHLEEAWNPTNQDKLFFAMMIGAYGQALELFKLRKHEEPLLQDAFFPSRATCNRLFRELYETFPQVKFISHDINVSYPPERLLVEVHPGIELSMQDILERSQQSGFGLVFDPKHLLEPERVISAPKEPSRLYKGEWERQFKKLSDNSDKLEVVDINPPSSSDLKELQRGRGLLRELAVAARETKTVKFLRVEIPMPIKNQISYTHSSQNGYEFLKEVGQRLMEG